MLNERYENRKILAKQKKKHNKKVGEGNKTSTTTKEEEVLFLSNGAIGEVEVVARKAINEASKKEGRQRQFGRSATVKLDVTKPLPVVPAQNLANIYDKNHFDLLAPFTILAGSKTVPGRRQNCPKDGEGKEKERDGADAEEEQERYLGFYFAGPPSEPYQSFFDAILSDEAPDPLLVVQIPDIDLIRRHEMGNLTPLAAAVLYGCDKKSIVEPLVKRGSFVVTPDYGKASSPLHIACAKGDSEAVEIMLDGCNAGYNLLFASNNQSPSGVDCALSQKKIDFVLWLLQKLVEKGNTDMCEVLLHRMDAVGFGLRSARCGENVLKLLSESNFPGYEALCVELAQDMCRRSDSSDNIGRFKHIWKILFSDKIGASHSAAVVFTAITSRNVEVFGHILETSPSFLFAAKEGRCALLCALKAGGRTAELALNNVLNTYNWPEKITTAEELSAILCAAFVLQRSGKIELSLTERLVGQGIKDWPFIGVFPSVKVPVAAALGASLSVLQQLVGRFGTKIVEHHTDEYPFTPLGAALSIGNEEITHYLLDECNVPLITERICECKKRISHSYDYSKWMNLVIASSSPNPSLAKLVGKLFASQQHQFALHDELARRLFAAPNAVEMFGELAPTVSINLCTLSFSSFHCGEIQQRCNIWKVIAEKGQFGVPVVCPAASISNKHDANLIVDFAATLLSKEQFFSFLRNISSRAVFIPGTVRAIVERFSTMKLEAAQKVLCDRSSDLLSDSCLEASFVVAKYSFDDEFTVKAFEEALFRMSYTKTTRMPNVLAALIPPPEAAAHDLKTCFRSNYCEFLFAYDHLLTSAGKRSLVDAPGMCVSALLDLLLNTEAVTPVVNQKKCYGSIELLDDKTFLKMVPRKQLLGQMLACGRDDLLVEAIAADEDTTDIKTTLLRIAVSENASLIEKVASMIPALAVKFGEEFTLSLKEIPENLLPTLRRILEVGDNDLPLLCVNSSNVKKLSLYLQAVTATVPETSLKLLSIRLAKEEEVDTLFFSLDGLPRRAFLSLIHGAYRLTSAAAEGVIRHTLRRAEMSVEEAFELINTQAESNADEEEDEQDPSWIEAVSVACASLFGVGTTIKVLGRSLFRFCQRCANGLEFKPQHELLRKSLSIRRKLVSFIWGIIPTAEMTVHDKSTFEPSLYLKFLLQTKAVTKFNVLKLNWESPDMSLSAKIDVLHFFLRSHEKGFCPARGQCGDKDSPLFSLGQIKRLTAAKVAQYFLNTGNFDAFKEFLIGLDSATDIQQAVMCVALERHSELFAEIVEEILPPFREKLADSILIPFLPFTAQIADVQLRDAENVIFDHSLISFESKDIGIVSPLLIAACFCPPSTFNDVYTAYKERELLAAVSETTDKTLTQLFGREARKFVLASEQDDSLPKVHSLTMKQSLGESELEERLMNLLSFAELFSNSAFQSFIRFYCHSQEACSAFVQRVPLHALQEVKKVSLKNCPPPRKNTSVVLQMLTLCQLELFMPFAVRLMEKTCTEVTKLQVLKLLISRSAPASLLQEFYTAIGADSACGEQCIKYILRVIGKEEHANLLIESLCGCESLLQQALSSKAVLQAACAGNKIGFVCQHLSADGDPEQYALIAIQYGHQTLAQTLLDRVEVLSNKNAFLQTCFHKPYAPKTFEFIVSKFGGVSDASELTALVELLFKFTAIPLIEPLLRVKQMLPSAVLAQGVDPNDWLFPRLALYVTDGNVVEQCKHLISLLKLSEGLCENSALLSPNEPLIIEAMKSLASSSYSDAEVKELVLSLVAVLLQGEGEVPFFVMQQMVAVSKRPSLPLLDIIDSLPDNIVGKLMRRRDEKGYAANRNDAFEAALLQSLMKRSASDVCGSTSEYDNFVTFMFKWTIMLGPKRCPNLTRLFSSNHHLCSRISETLLVTQSQMLQLSNYGPSLDCLIVHVSRPTKVSPTKRLKTSINEEVSSRISFLQRDYLNGALENIDEQATSETTVAHFSEAADPNFNFLLKETSGDLLPTNRQLLTLALPIEVTAAIEMLQKETGWELLDAHRVLAVKALSKVVLHFTHAEEKEWGTFVQLTRSAVHLSFNLHHSDGPVEMDPSLAELCFIVNEHYTLIGRGKWSFDGICPRPDPIDIEKMREVFRPIRYFIDRMRWFDMMFPPCLADKTQEHHRFALDANSKYDAMRKDILQKNSASEKPEQLVFYVAELAEAGSVRLVDADGNLIFDPSAPQLNPEKEKATSEQILAACRQAILQDGDRSNEWELTCTIAEGTGPSLAQLETLWLPRQLTHFFPKSLELLEGEWGLFAPFAKKALNTLQKVELRFEIAPEADWGLRVELAEDGMGIVAKFNINERDFATKETIIDLPEHYCVAEIIANYRVVKGAMTFKQVNHWSWRAAVVLEYNFIAVVPSAASASIDSMRPMVASLKGLRNALHVLQLLGSDVTTFGNDKLKAWRIRVLRPDELPDPSLITDNCMAVFVHMAHNGVDVEKVVARSGTKSRSRRPQNWQLYPLQFQSKLLMAPVGEEEEKEPQQEKSEPRDEEEQEEESEGEGEV